MTNTEATAEFQPTADARVLERKGVRFFYGSMYPTCTVTVEGLGIFTADWDGGVANLCAATSRKEVAAHYADDPTAAKIARALPGPAIRTIAASLRVELKG